VHYVYNNLFYQNRNNGIEVYGGTNFIDNNTIYGNGQAGIRGLRDGDIVCNNIIYGNGEGPYANEGSPTLSNNLTSNPSFVNASAGDFHLQAGSAAIDRGMTLANVRTDLEEHRRPQGGGYDIGAYEYPGKAPRPQNAPKRPRRINR
jgi:hypothetical protein